MKKGFTIIELITVVVLLSLISLFTFPSVNKVINNRRESLYNIQVDNIKSSAVSYIDKEGLLKNNDKVIVTLCQLQQNGFSDEKLKNPINGKYIPSDSKVIVTKEEKKFIYGNDEKTACTKDDTTIFEYVEVGSTYIEKIDTSSYDVTIYKDETIVDKIDTTKVGSYFIEYNGNNKITKYVYVVDTTSPSILYKNEVNGSNEIGKGLITLEANQGLFNPFEVVVTDNSLDIINPVISTNVNLKIPGTYYVNYTATDSSLNSITKTQTIKVEDTISPKIESVNGNPENKTPMTVIISVIAYDEGVGLHPLGAYSFDGGKTWQVENNITVDKNTDLEIVVRDSANNQTSHIEKITNVLKDDKNISYTIKNGKINSNGWFTTNVDVLVKPLVSEEYFESFSYCIGNEKCTPNIVSKNYNGETVELTENTSGTLICGNVNKKDGTSTDVLCSILFKIDKSIPSAIYKVMDGKQNSGYEPWYVSNVTLKIETESISGIDEVEYCITNGDSCNPNKIINGNDFSAILSNNGLDNKVCSIITNKAGTKSGNVCSNSHKIDKVIPDVSISIVDGADGYVGKTGTLKAIVNPSSNVSGYNYIWYKNGKKVGGNSDTLNITNASDIYVEDTYKVEVITGAGNKGEASSKVKVDTIKPTCSLSLNGTEGKNGWFISNSVIINGTFKDSESGVGSKGVGTGLDYNGNASYNLKSNTNGTTIYCSVKDKVGNEGSNSINIKKDDGSDASCNLMGQNSNWTNNSVTVSYYIKSNYSKFGSFKTNTSSVSSVSGDGYTATSTFYRDNWSEFGFETRFGITGSSYKTMHFNSWSAELESGATVTCPEKTANVYYDGIAPSCTYNGNSTWTNKPVTVSIGCNDSESGCKSGTGWKETFSAFSTLSTTNSTTIFDNAGNSTFCSGTMDVKLDVNAPTCSISVTGTGKDGVSGSVTGADTGGSELKSAGQSFSGLKESKGYTFTDNAGNSTTCTVNVTSTTEYRSRSCKNYKNCTHKDCGTSPSCSGSIVRKWGNVSNCQSYRNVEFIAGTCCDNEGNERKLIEVTNSCRTAACGCDSWHGWSDWSTSSCSSSSSKQCESRSLYSVKK